MAHGACQRCPREIKLPLVVCPLGLYGGAGELGLQLPAFFIVDNSMIWVAAVEHDGLEEARKVPGYHDEPLKGDRAGPRSIRSSKAYGAIYEIKEDTAKLVSGEEVNKHEY